MINTYIVQFYPLFHLPLADLLSNRYSFGRYRKPMKFGWNIALFRHDSRNIGRIANVKLGCERAAKTAQSTYWSCHNTIRTQILNCSSTWAKDVRTIKWNCSLCLTRPNIRSFMSGPGKNPDKTKQIRLLDCFRIDRNHFSGPFPDHWLITPTHC